MADRQGRLLVAMGAILVGLVAFLVFVEPPADSDPDVPTWSAAFAGIDDAELVRIGFDSDDEAWEVVRAEGDWRLELPRQTGADADQVEQLANALQGLRVGEDLGRTGGAPYGLDPGAAVGFTLADGSAHTLLVGDATPGGRGTYVRLPDGTVRVTQRPLSVPSADALRSRAVVSLRPATVTALTLEQIDVDDAPRSWALTQDDHGWWLSSASSTHRADDDAVRALLRDVASLRVDSFVDGPAHVDPAWSLTATTLDGTERLVIGQGAGASRMVSGAAQEHPAEVVLPASLTDLDPSSLRAQTLLPLRTATLTELRVRLGATSLSASRSDSGWSEPTAEPALAVLGALSTDRSPAAPPEGAAWGEIVLTEGTQRTERVTLYQAVDGRRVAVDAAGGDPFWVEQAALEALARAATGP